MSEHIKDSKNIQAKRSAVNQKGKVDRKAASNCDVVGKCGGCKGFSESYEMHLAKKAKAFAKLCSKYGKPEAIIGADQPYHYRHKVHAVFGEDRKHNIISGTYEEKSHKIVPIDCCMLEHELADRIIVSIRNLLKSFKIRPYNEDTGYGLLRHVMIRAGYHTGEIMVVLVASSPIFPSKNNFVKALRQLHPEITTIVLNVNSKRTSMVLGDKETILYGKGYIEDQLCGKTFRISSKSFYQVNPAQAEKLYRKALEFADLSGNERVLDAYCGTGTIGMVASDHADSVIGVELNKDAVADAKVNAKRNGVKNIKFYEQDAGKFMVHLATQKEKIDVVLMDPPRSGSDQAFLNAVAMLAPQKVVYVSCNPETMVRDLKVLTSKGYHVEKMVAVDMFPWTEHVETVCLLSKLREAKHHVSVKLDMEEMDITAAESKATYEEIKQYVAEHNGGMKVSSLNIAQVKAKYGIIERENFNKSKSEEEKQPQCSKEKEEAIEEALKEFQMIIK